MRGIPGRWAAVAIGLAIGFGVASASGVETLADLEGRELTAYLARLRQGEPGSAEQLDRLSDLDFPALRQVIEAYLALPADAELHTHHSFQNLLERNSRSATLPWALLRAYGPGLADWLLEHGPAQEAANRLCDRLLASGVTRKPYDLVVRLTPAASLRRLAGGETPQATELFEAWQRRLARGQEDRPLPELAALRAAIAARPRSKEPARFEAELKFLGAWPELREAYERALSAALGAADAATVRAGLAAQRLAPACLGDNAKLIERFSREESVVETALRNFALDATADQSALLRSLWGRLPAEQTRARYACLVAMGTHFRGNDGLALAAVQAQPYELFDAAAAVLAHGEPARAEKAIAHVLAQGQRGREEALRLARKLKLTGFAAQAARLALDREQDQVLRQTALGYLQICDGAARRRTLPLLAEPNADVRLAAIQTWVEPAGLAEAEQNEAGPMLVRAALSDESPGHRQEALFALGAWKQPAAAELFRKVRAENPPLESVDGAYNDARYWRYRQRLVATLGLARLGDAEARRELLATLARGGPTERMDALLAFHELGEVPPGAWEDLASLEPKLAATAARLIAAHGDAAAREKLRAHVRRTPLWEAFRRGGIDDQNLLRYAEGRDEE